MAVLSGGLNDIWFALGASAPLAVLSAAGVGRSLDSIAPARTWSPRAIVWVSAVAGLMVFAVATAIWLTHAGQWRWLGPIAAWLLAGILALLIVRLFTLQRSRRFQVFAVFACILVVASAPSRALGVVSERFGVLPAQGLNPSEFSAMSAFVPSLDQQPVTAWDESVNTAAAWLRGADPDNALVATNVTFSPLVPALTGTLMFVSGIQYQAPYGRAAQVPTALWRERASINFIDHPSTRTATVLCRSHVVWVWIDVTRTTQRSWAPFGTLVHHTNTVDIVHLNPHTCS